MISSSKIPDNERRVAWRLSQLLVLGAFFVLVSSFWNTEESEQTLEVNPPIASESSTTTAAADEVNEPDDVRSFTFAASGEILVHEFVANAAYFDRLYSGEYLYHWRFKYMFDFVQEVLGSADLAICHLETPLNGLRDGIRDFDPGHSYYPNFNVPHEIADAISYAGYDGCSVASNHSLDVGVEGVENTLENLDRVGVQAVGMSTTPIETPGSFFNAGGISVAHLSVTDTLNNASLPTDPIWLVSHLDIDRIISDAQSTRTNGAEFVIVSVHWGEEYISELSTHQQQTIRALLDSEHIDLVIGHGTHVPQSIMIHNEKYAVAGLGNFLSNQPGDERRRCNECPPATQDGMILWLEIEENKEGKIIVAEASYYPTFVDRTNYEIVLVDFPNGEPFTRNALGSSFTPQANAETLSASAERTASVVEPLLTKATSLPSD